VDSYLESLNSEGSRLGNDLEFTIDPLKQAERYATFQHQNSVYCLLRIFQGLTLAHAESVDIKVEKRCIRLTARCKSTELRPEKLLDALSRSDRIPVQEHLCIGLFAATHESVERLEVILGRDKLVVEQSGFQLQETDKTSQDFQAILHHSKRGWMESGAKEQLELAGRLHHAPLPVTIDSQTLFMNDPAPEKERWYKELTRPQLLVKTVQRLPKEGYLQPLQDSLFLTENSEGSQYFVFLDPNGTLFIDLDFTEHQKIVPIIDGVAGTPIETGRFPGLHGCHNLPGARTDLSGLALLDKELFLSEVEKRYRALLELLIPHLSHLKAVWPKNFDLSGAVGAATFAGELALITVPVTLFFGGMYQAYDKLSFRIQQKKAEQALHQQTEARIKGLLEGTH
jgi:hypothetical protein